MKFDSHDQYLAGWSEGKSEQEIEKWMNFYNQTFGEKYEGPIYMVVKKEYF